MKITNILGLLIITMACITGSLIAINGVGEEYGVPYNSSSFEALNKTSANIDEVNTIVEDLGAALYELGVIDLINIPKKLFELTKNLLSLGDSFMDLLSGLLQIAGLPFWLIAALGSIVLLIVGASIWNSIAGREKN